MTRQTLYAWLIILAAPALAALLSCLLYHLALEHLARRPLASEVSPMNISLLLLSSTLVAPRRRYQPDYRVIAAWAVLLIALPIAVWGLIARILLGII
jgi:hypothetical protein